MFSIVIFVYLFYFVLFFVLFCGLLSVVVFVLDLVEIFATTRKGIRILALSQDSRKPQEGGGPPRLAPTEVF